VYVAASEVGAVLRIWSIILKSLELFKNEDIDLIFLNDQQYIKVSVIPKDIT